MATEEDKELYKKSEEWDTEGVCKWLESKGLGDVCQAFRDEEIVGLDLPFIAKRDLRDMKIPVGLRLRVMKELGIIRINKAIALKNDVKWFDDKWYLCPCFVPFKTKYILTATSFTIYQGACCERSFDRVDLSNFRDLQQEKYCMNATIDVHTMDQKVYQIKCSRDKMEEIYNTLNGAWEMDQSAMAGMKG